MTKNELFETPTPAFIYRQYLYRKLINMLPAGHRFLEVGCGNGTTLSYLLEKGFHGKGIDFSEKALAYVQNKISIYSEQVVFERKSIFDLFEKEEYDLILFFMVLEHIEDQCGAMRQINKLMVNNGLLLIGLPAHKSLWSKDDEEKGHYRRYGRGEVISLLAEYGFKIEIFWCYGFPFLNLLLYIKKLIYLVRRPGIQRDDKEYLTKISAIDKEYPTFLRILFCESFMKPFIKIMDLFLGKDCGVGYIILAKKIKSVD